ncbi:radical SAM family heme chaperone HemW [Candidatus Latescibacterota bacterium]
MPFSLYIHIPFCKSKCPYCNFSSIIGSEELIEQYLKALTIELDNRLRCIYSSLPRTIYIGGGTPSIIPSEHINKTVERFMSDNSIEFTVEANPESIRKSWLKGILKSGVNRLSIGIQSLDDSILCNLGRLHRAKEAISSIEMAKQAGFSNISVDLMFGVPGQTMEIWQKTLEKVIELEPDHVSCYSLGIEDDTKYYTMLRKGYLKIPDEDETADMYLFMVNRFEKEGFVRYEISNFARRGKECKHNQAYWNFTPYLGIGASAHSYDGNMRSWNVTDPGIYINKIVNQNDATAGKEILDEKNRICEVVMLSLRTDEGLNIEKIKSLPSENNYTLTSKISSFVESGFMEILENGNIRLTKQGAVIANEIILDILSDIS